MTDGIFKREGHCCYARATEILSTQSATGFEWSIKLMSDYFNVGIASQFKQEKKFIFNYDPTAISYRYQMSVNEILMGSRVIHDNLPILNTGDIIRFQFQPERKKLVIHSVRQ